MTGINNYVEGGGACAWWSRDNNVIEHFLLHTQERLNCDHNMWCLTTSDPPTFGSVLDYPVSAIGNVSSR